MARGINRGAVGSIEAIGMSARPKPLPAPARGARIDAILAAGLRALEIEPTASNPPTMTMRRENGDRIYYEAGAKRRVETVEGLTKFYEGDVGQERLVKEVFSDGDEFEYARPDQFDQFDLPATTKLINYIRLQKGNALTMLDYNWTDVAIRHGLALPMAYGRFLFPLFPWAERPKEYILNILPQMGKKSRPGAWNILPKRANPIEIGFLYPGAKGDDAKLIDQLVTFPGDRETAPTPLRWQFNFYKLDKLANMSDDKADEEERTAFYKERQKVRFVYESVNVSALSGLDVSGTALNFIFSDRFVPFGEREGLLRAVRINGQELFRFHLGPKLKEVMDESTFKVYGSVRETRMKLSYANGTYLDDEEILTAALEQDGLYGVESMISDPDLKRHIDNKELMEAAVRQNGDALRVLPSKYEKNPSFRLSAAASSVYYATTVLKDMQRDLLLYKPGALNSFIRAFRGSRFGQYLFGTDVLDKSDAYTMYGDAASKLTAHWATPKRVKLNLSLDEIELYEEIQRLAEDVLTITEHPDGPVADRLRKEFEQEFKGMVGKRGRGDDYEANEQKKLRTGAAVWRTHSAHWDHTLMF